MERYTVAIFEGSPSWAVTPVLRSFWPHIFPRHSKLYFVRPLVLSIENGRKAGDLTKAWFPLGLENLENGKAFSSQGILIRRERSGNFGKIRNLIILTILGK